MTFVFYKGILIGRFYPDLDGFFSMADTENLNYELGIPETAVVEHLRVF